VDVETHEITLPRIIKHIISLPPVPIKFLREVSIFKESQGGLDEEILSQLIRDLKYLDSLSHPITIFKYENEEMINTTNGEVHYVVRVWYDATFQRMKYTYERIGLNNATGKWKLKKLDWLQSPKKPSETTMSAEQVLAKTKYNY
jgi:hypothetical protein